MVQAQEWLDRNYPKEQRKETKILNLSGWDFVNRKEKADWEKLEGHLDLKDFVNCEFLDFSLNKITTCDLFDLNKLKWIGCNDNNLKNFDYFIFNPQQLNYFNISDNDLQEQNLSVFSRFSNLNILYIGNGDQEN